MKLILMTEGNQEMTLEECFLKFQNYLHHLIKSWKGIYEYEDLFQIASLGLVKAYRTYNADKGINFMTYLSMVVNNETGMNHRMNDRHRTVESLNTPVKDAEYVDHFEIIPDTARTFEEVEDRETLKKYLESISERERNLVIDSYIKDIPQYRLEARYGISRSHISRVIKKAIEKMGNIRRYER